MIMVMFVLCCCFKGYRKIWFTLWDKWSPKNFWKETSEKLCMTITNVQGKSPVHFHPTQGSPATSVRSLSLPLIPDNPEDLLALKRENRILLDK